MCPVPSSPARTTIRVQGDLTVTVPDTLSELTPFVLREQEDWFERELPFLRTWLKPGMQTIDIGANYGLYTLNIASRVGPSGAVWSFEPAMATAACLQASVKDNGLDQVQVVRSALSNRTGEARLALENSADLNQLVADTDARENVETVPLTTLDAAAEQFGWDNIDFIKLDAEGEEVNIIRGGREFLERQSPLIMYEFRHQGIYNTHLIEEFQKRGYKSYRLIPGIACLIRVERLDDLDPAYLNLFCCKDDWAKKPEQKKLLGEDSVNTVPPEPEGKIETLFENQRYADATRTDWIDQLKNSTVPPWPVWREILTRFDAARANTALSPTERYAHLLTARRLAEQLFGELPTIARGLTVARLLTESGDLSQANHLLTQLLGAVGNHKLDYGEPFLAPSSRYEQVDPAGRLPAWCRAAVLESWAGLCSWSAYFTKDSMLPILEKFPSLEFPSAVMERRLQLVRMKYGMQSGPKAHPVLSGHAPDNLNPDYWSGTNT